MYVKSEALIYTEAEVWNQADQSSSHIQAPSTYYFFPILLQYYTHIYA
jgi:hypothetical protein